MDTWEALPLEEKNRFSRQIKSTLQNLQTVGQDHSHMATLPLGQPDTVPKKAYKRKRKTEESRALTANEIGIEGRLQQAREERRQARDTAIDEARRQQHPGNDSQLGPSAGFSLISDRVFDVDRDDYESPPPPPPPPRPTQRKPSKAPQAPPKSLSPTPPADDPPPSTAPPRLSRTGRIRTKTARKEEAQAAGYLPESQTRRWAEMWQKTTYTMKMSIQTI